jgi:histidinol-phosphate aminotransferase
VKKELFREQILAIKPYVPGKPVEEVERELGISNVIKLASNENPLGPSPLALEAMKGVISKVALYPDGNCFYLKNLLAEFWGVTPAHLIVGNGSDEVIKLIAEAFLDEGEEAVVGHPSFSEYDFAVKIMGGKTIPVPLKNDTYDLPAMAEAVTDKTKLVFVCNPNNPTGTIVSKAELDKLLSGLPEHVITVIDEAYYEYVMDKSYPESLDYVHEGKNVIVLRTFSKIYGLAGLRVGYGVAKPELISSLMRVREPFNVNMVAQAAAFAALGDKGHVERSRDANEEGKAYLYGEFKRMGLDYAPTEANFIWLVTRADCQNVFAKLLRRGVIVRTGDIFGAPDVIRVTIGTMDQNNRFITNLEEVLKEEGVLK